MPVSHEVVDSPTEWVADHIHKYVESDGHEGHLWNGVATLLLTTTGRKSGTLHRTALIYGRDADRYLIMASKGGAPKHPLWYLNLVANPEVELQVGDEKFAAHASVAAGAERDRLWKIMAAIWTYDEYQAKTEREIPLVILERV
ncbi:MAG: nitroreductase family deazaflavin-dependent oxidoreductase [Nakamurella sp.]